jgi:hypothetical protein
MGTRISTALKSQNDQTIPFATAQLHFRPFAGGSSYNTTTPTNEAEDKGKQRDALVSGSAEGAKQASTGHNRAVSLAIFTGAQFLISALEFSCLPKPVQVRQGWAAAFLLPEKKGVLKTRLSRKLSPCASVFLFQTLGTVGKGLDMRLLLMTAGTSPTDRGSAVLLGRQHLQITPDMFTMTGS